MTEPFGTYASPQWMDSLLSKMRQSNLALVRRLAKRIVHRYLKTKSRPFDVTIDGVKLRLFPKDNLHDRMIIMKQVFPDAEWFDRLFGSLPGDAVFVDIGANIGMFSLAACANGPASAKIIAVEPHPRMRARLINNLTVNDFDKRVWVEGCAIGAEDGTLPLYQPSRHNTGVSTLHAAGEARSEETFSVAVRPLASVLADRGIERIDLLKIDIEGFEDRALIPFFETAPQELWPRAVFIEYHSNERWERDLLEEMRQRGYVEEATDSENALFVRNP